jgi:hypothetical protein
LEKLATNKHSSLLRIFINYGKKKFYNIETWQGGQAAEKAAKEGEEAAGDDSGPQTEP